MSIAIHCIKCNKTIHEVKGWLERINPRGEKGIFECRPNCNANLTKEQSLIQAIAEPTKENK